MVSNAETSVRLGLPPNWIEDRTGIVSRHVCAPGETVTSLAADAIRSCLGDAGLSLRHVGVETVLLYIQNGVTHLTPPAGIYLASHLQLARIRVMSLDGVCSEPIHAMEVGALMLSQGRCERVIICAAADFMPIVNDRDQDTAGLFGSGAGALLLQRTSSGGTGAFEGVYWESDATYWDLGVIPVIRKTRTLTGMNVDLGYYEMKGTELARVAVRTIRHVIGKVLKDADWDVDCVDHFVSHQPNPKMLEIGVRKLALPLDRVTVPGKTLGNMGPASVLVAFSMLRKEGKLLPGKRVLAASFGLGFSCGCAAITI